MKRVNDVERRLQAALKPPGTLQQACARFDDAIVAGLKANCQEQLLILIVTPAICRTTIQRRLRLPLFDASSHFSPDLVPILPRISAARRRLRTYVNPLRKRRHSDLSLRRPTSRGPTASSLMTTTRVCETAVLLGAITA